MNERARAKAQVSPGRSASTGWRVMLAFAATMQSSCGDLGFTSEVVGRRPFDPPMEYREWWSATEDCSGRRGSFDRVSWYLADGITGDGVFGRGRWSAPHDIIVLAGHETDGKLVRHEMLHDLLNGDRSHGRAEWDACGLRASRQ